MHQQFAKFCILMKGGRAGSTEKDPKNSQVPIIVKIDMFAKEKLMSNPILLIFASLQKIR